ncbi:MAG: hypothetical protein Q4E05_11975 [Pseudoclavibacter sp.]|nr:hypothetical protein [Pseudoclavibacter sp.]
MSSRPGVEAVEDRGALLACLAAYVLTGQIGALWLVSPDGAEGPLAWAVRAAPMALLASATGALVGLLAFLALRQGRRLGLPEPALWAAGALLPPLLGWLVLLVGSELGSGSLDGPALLIGTAWFCLAGTPVAALAAHRRSVRGVAAAVSAGIAALAALVLLAGLFAG